MSKKAGKFIFASSLANSLRPSLANSLRVLNTSNIVKQRSFSYSTKITSQYQIDSKYLLNRSLSKSNLQSRYYSTTIIPNPKVFSAGSNALFIGLASSIAFITLASFKTIFYTEEVQSERKDTKTPQQSTSPPANSFRGVFGELRKWWHETFADVFNSHAKLFLPDALPPPLGKAYTIIIADDVLAKSIYDPVKGFMTKKRPGVEFFLSVASVQFEVAIFSMQGIQSYGPIIDKLDPNKRAAYRLFRDSSVLLHDGREIKDLSLSNRDLGKLLVIDSDYANVSHKENVILVPAYDGSDFDMSLVELEYFLKFLSWAHPPDIRPFIKIYQEKGGVTFKEKYKSLLTTYADNSGATESE